MLRPPVLRLLPLLSQSTLARRLRPLRIHSSIEGLRRFQSANAPKPPDEVVSTSRAEPPDNVKDNIYTVPNALCLLRIGLTPLIGWLVMSGSNPEAFALFFVAGLTDMADGQIARRFPSQQSFLGTMIDPVADKLLISTLFVTLTCVDLIPALTGLVFLRDFLLLAGAFRHRYATMEPPITLRRYFDPSISTIAIQPTFASKLNTVLQMCSVAAALAAPLLHFQDHPALYTLWLCTALTTAYSGVQYIGGGAIRHIKRKKAKHII